MKKTISKLLFTHRNFSSKYDQEKNEIRTIELTRQCLMCNEFLPKKWPWSFCQFCNNR